MKTIKSIIVATAGPYGTDGANTGYTRNGGRAARWRGLLAASLVALFGAAINFSAIAGSPLTFSGFGTATIDGVLSPGEWDNASSRDLDVNLPEVALPVPGTVYVMNDGSNLYFALRFKQEIASAASLYLFFDNDNDGPPSELEEGDNIVFLRESGSFLDMYWGSTDPPCTGSVPCPIDDDTQDGDGAYSNDGTWTTFEISLPLDSSDDSQDFSLGIGDTVGFILDLFLETGVPDATTIYPADFTFAHITIAPPVPETPVLTTDIMIELGANYVLTGKASCDRDEEDDSPILHVPVTSTVTECTGDFSICEEIFNDSEKPLRLKGAPKSKIFACTGTNSCVKMYQYILGTWRIFEVCSEEIIIE